MSNIYSSDILDHLVRTKLSSFYEQSFPKFDAGETYLHNWYIDLLCEYLEAFAKGEIKRLNINIPPRFGKSALCNVSFTMWMLGLNPEMKIITISYAATLSEKLHGYARAISNTSWYHRAFPDFNIDPSKSVKIDESEKKNTQSGFITSAGGFRIAASTNGSITGEGGKILIFDDMMNPEEAMSMTQRTSALNWTRGTAFSRFNNRKDGQMMNIQQRLNDDDFTGSFVDSSWENVIVPIMARADIQYAFGDFRKLYKEGEYLEPRRYGPTELEEDKRNMGSKVVEAQFFQVTAPDDGEVFSRRNFRYYRFLPKMDFYAIYADTAEKEGRDNDYSVLQCWGLVTRNGRKYAYLVDSIRGKWRASILKANAQSFWDKWLHNERGTPLIKFAIEDKSSGTGLIQDLMDESNIPVVKLIADKDKVARANDVVPRFESAQVFFQHDADYLQELERELLLFSTIKNNNKKDQVDTMTYAIKDLLFDIFDDKNRPTDYRALVTELL